jgi:hypothetical protein
MFMRVNSKCAHQVRPPLRPDGETPVVGQPSDLRGPGTAIAVLPTPRADVVALQEPVER